MPFDRKIVPIIDSLRCGKATVPHSITRPGWVLPGGKFVEDRRMAQRLCERIDEIMHGERTCDVRMLGVKS